MNILFVTASIPYPPQQGGALRTYGILHGLHQAGHQLTLLSLADSSHTAYKNSPLEHWCNSIETVQLPHRTKSQRLRSLLLSKQPDIARRLYSEVFRKRLLELATTNSYDIIQFEGIEVACYLPTLKAIAMKTKLVYDAFNAESSMQFAIFQLDRKDIRRWAAAAYSWIQARRIANFERALCDQADLVIAVSNEDATLLQKLVPKKRIPVVANGVFVGEYQDLGTDLELGENALVFTGKMDYRPNVDAALWFTAEILPLVKQVINDVKLYIVGQKPHPALERLRDNESIIVTGWVESVLPYLKSSHIYVAPLRMGSGTRLKILEAMASKSAVVATSLAASGMKQTTEMGIVIEDNPQAIAQAIIDLLRNPEQRAILGDKACKYVRNNYDWSVIIPNLLNAYEAIRRG